MSNKPMPWIKQFPTRLHDARLFSLNDRQKLRYYEMYMLAGQLNADGAFIQDGKELTAAEIAHLLRVHDHKQFEKDLIALKKSKLVRANGHGPFIADFKDEQINWVELQRSNRERQARFKQSHSDNALVTDESRVGNAPRTRVQNQSQNQSQIQNQPTTPTPPSNKDGSPLVGGVVGSKKGDDLLAGPEFKTITKKARKELTAISQVLALSGLGRPKLVDLLGKVATRSSPRNKMQFVLAALASVYDDKAVRNKAIVAMHRIEKNTVPAEYFSPAMWEHIPEDILKVAGDLDQFETARRSPVQKKLDILYQRNKERNKKRNKERE
jgi:hypothetical protein